MGQNLDFGMRKNSLNIIFNIVEDGSIKTVEGEYRGSRKYGDNNTCVSTTVKNTKYHVNAQIPKSEFDNIFATRAPKGSIDLRKVQEHAPKLSV